MKYRQAKKIFKTPAMWERSRSLGRMGAIVVVISTPPRAAVKAVSRRDNAQRRKRHPREVST